MNTFERFVGTYEGAGVWHDSAGKSLAYRVRQTSLPTANGFEIAFKHDFHDGTVTDARFNMTWLAPHIRFVEASYRSSADAVEVFGSSTRNPDGNYIAWRETIRRC